MDNEVLTKFIGKRIELIEMIDSYPIQPGTIGVIVGYELPHKLLVKWDTGSSLSIIINVDKFIVVDS